MTEAKDCKLALRIAVALFVVGVLSYAYAAFSASEPVEPVRKAYQCVAGQVMFTHKTHVADYDIGCKDCHHHPQEDEEETDTRACGACHVLPPDGSAPESCEDCHSPDEIEVETIIKRSDAFHKQCIDCHTEKEAGPMECASCHVI